MANLEPAPFSHTPTPTPVATPVIWIMSVSPPTALAVNFNITGWFASQPPNSTANGTFELVMPMRYAIAAMQRHLEAGHKQLPLVIPILFYQGQQSPYPYSMNRLQAFSEPTLAGQLYREDFPLVDITVIPDDEIMQHKSMAALTLLQKHIRQRDLTELLDQLVLLLVKESVSGQQLIALVNYMIQVGETPDAQGFIRELAQRVPEHGGELMTIAQQLKQLGREEGRKEGMQEGMQQGKQEGMQLAFVNVARTMLANGYDWAVITAMTGLTEDDLKQDSH